MTSPQPIKRNESLVPLSRDHHHGLLLAWKIKRGLAKEVAFERIMRYARWFYQTHLVPHFAEEEQLVFPILGENHPLIVQALEEHKNLHALFNEGNPTKNPLAEIVVQLENHIRFEERTLFNKIQAVATAGQVAVLSRHDKEEQFCDDESDPFWL